MGSMVIEANNGNSKTGNGNKSDYELWLMALVQIWSGGEVGRTQLGSWASIPGRWPGRQGGVQDGIVTNRGVAPTFKEVECTSHSALNCIGRDLW